MIDLTNKRWCYMIHPNSKDENGYIPCIAIEGEPGVIPLSGQGVGAQPWYWGKELDQALEICNVRNDRLGLRPKDVERILFSVRSA